MSWEKVKLSNVSTDIQTGPFGSQLHQSDYSETGTPVVMPKDLINGKISEESIARVPSSHVERLKKHKIKTGDILYSRRGDVGRCAFATVHEENWLCGTGCLRVTVDELKANPKFVFYQLQKAETIGWVVNHAVGATMLNLNTSILSDVPLELPDLKTQHRIVDMLSAYDDLIENNQKQIKLLEEAAQRLYKEWFVDLRFPGHEESKIVDGVPEGWKKVQLGEVFTTVLGGTPSRNKIDYWGGNIPWINSGAVNNLRIVKESEFITELGLSNSSTKIMPVHTTVLAITGATLGQVSYTEIEVCANQSVVGVYDSKDIYNEFIYLTISNKIKEIISEAMGGAQQHINKDVVNRFEVVMPDNDINKKLKNQIKPLFKKIINLCCDIENLKEARDRLLPKLMNGEIEV